MPLVSSGTFCATNVENNGESAITAKPHTKRNPNKRQTELPDNTRGESRQQIPDINKAIAATFFAPNTCESNPLTTQAILPNPIIRNDKKEIFNSTSE